MAQKFYWVIVFSMLFISCTPVKPDITGEWNAEGYNCGPSRFYEEVIGIQTSSNNYEIGVKIKGDPCVQTGDTSFIVKWNEKECVFEGKIKGYNYQTNETIFEPCKVFMHASELWLTIYDEPIIIFNKR